MKEIGSFIELQFEKGKEYYSGINVARLNSGRAGIYHAVRVLGCSVVYLPYYQCETVRKFLIRKGLEIRYYNIDSTFTPNISFIPDNAAIVIVNYFGIISRSVLNLLANKFQNVIVDNSQAFFAEPIERCMNIYSARKFIGVPDGSYVIGEKACSFYFEYDQDYSSETAGFLLRRIEFGCEGETYVQRMENEHRIDSSDVLKMSKLTHAILDGTNYKNIIDIRKQNFLIACELFEDINKIDPQYSYDETCVPMVYPLVVENDITIHKLIQNKIFQGHWWSYLLNEVDKTTFEYWLSRYMIPIHIDQRYCKKDLEMIKLIIESIK